MGEQTGSGLRDADEAAFQERNIGTLKTQLIPASLNDDNVAQEIEKLPVGPKPVWSVAKGSMYFEATEITDAIPAGLYRCLLSQQGPYLSRMKRDIDELIELPDTKSAQVLDEIKTFWSKKDLYKKLGLIHKRGVLMFGPAGSGKTATIQQLITRIIRDLDGIAIYLDQPSTAATCLQMLRRIEPDRPVIAILEDIDALIAKFPESEYLALLDGESQIDNVVYIGTTNYPEKLDSRFTDRPSRFDLVIEIGMPTAAARKCYLSAKASMLSSDDVERWVAETDGFSVAHLRELIILVLINDYPLEKAIARLEHMRQERPSSSKMDDGKKAALGFRSAVRHAS